jgi:hypothetical protein
MRVSYSRLFALGNFENEKVEAEDEVGPNETYEMAYERLRALVEEEHTKTMASRSLVRSKGEAIWQLEAKLQRAESRAAEVIGYWRRGVRQYNELRELLAKHGVDLPELDSYYLPPEPKIEPGETETSPEAEAELADGWSCPECGDHFFNASAWSEMQGNDVVGGVKCPSCGTFVPSEV